MSEENKNQNQGNAATPNTSEEASEVKIPEKFKSVVESIEKMSVLHLNELVKLLEKKFGGGLPETVEALCELPGVGRKTANLVVALGFDKPAVCVDVHVHRITNRLGLLATKTPYDTEMALREILPVRYWKTWNSCLVSFGQTRCSPRNPHCKGCPIAAYCDSRQE